MSRNSKFALSWGRKTFFGMGWLFISLLGLNYFQSLVIPQGFAGWIYFITTFIGHYGLLLSVVYFLLYVPVILLFPKYYVARIWSLVLLAIGCLLLLIDSLVFSQYRFHLNGFIFDLLFGGAAKDIFQFPVASFAAIGGGLFAFILFFWLTGEKLWRSMQRHFSNPNKNWYFGLIAICLFLSHGIHIYGAAVGDRKITRLANLFPLHFPTTANRLLKKNGIIPTQVSDKPGKGFNDFYYPHGKMKCEGKTNKNVVFIVLDSWRSDEMDEVTTPTINHLKQHGTYFSNHYSGSNNTRGGIFSLFYGLPATYWDLALKNQTPSVIMDEFRNRGYDLGIFASASLISPEFDRTVFAKIPNLRISTMGTNPVFKDLQITSEWKEWTRIHNEEHKDKPFFGFLFYDAPHAYDYPKDFEGPHSPAATEINYLFLNNNTEPLPYLNRHKNSVSFVDTLVKDVIDDLSKKNLLKDTIVIITGDHGQEINDNRKNYWGHNSNYSPVQTKVPLIVTWPGKRKGTETKLTNHYDIVPTIMSEVWGCTNKLPNYSYGENLYQLPERNWMIVASYSDYGVIDFEKRVIMTVDTIGDYEVTDLELNEKTKSRSNDKVLLEVFKDLARFHQK